MDETTTYDDELVYEQRRPRYSRQPLVQDEPQRRERIKVWMGFLLIWSALIVDIIEWIGGDISFEIIAAIAGFIASLVFWIWFRLLQVPYSSNTKRYAVTLITNIAEVIPGLDIAQITFLWTVGMIIIVGMVRMEDKGEEPGIIGGFMEGIGLCLLFNPITIVSTGAIMVAVNKTRRTLKKKAGRKASLAKDEELDRQIKEEMRDHPERVERLRAMMQSSGLAKNVLNLKKPK